MEIIHTSYGRPLKWDLGLNHVLLRISGCGKQMFAGMVWCERHIALVYGCSFEKRYTLYPISGVNEMIRIIPCPDL